MFVSEYNRQIYISLLEERDWLQKLLPLDKLTYIISLLGEESG